MITDEELLEHFDLFPSSDNETIEHYGRKGMRWGQRIFSGHRSLTARKKSKSPKQQELDRKRKEAKREARAQRKAAKRAKRLEKKARIAYEKQARKDSIKYIKNLKRVARDVGYMSADDVKKMATRLENEAKIRKHAQEAAKYLPKTKGQRFMEGMEKISKMNIPTPVYDKNGNLTGYSADGTVGDLVTKAAIRSATAYLNREFNTNIESDKVENVANVAKKAKETVNKVREQRQ